jgi:hypothetical protein
VVVVVVSHQQFSCILVVVVVVKTKVKAKKYVRVKHQLYFLVAKAKSSTIYPPI